MEQGKGGGGSGAPPPQDAPGAPRAGGHRPGPQLAQQQGWGVWGGVGRPPSSLLLGGEPLARYCLPLPGLRSAVETRGRGG